MLLLHLVRYVSQIVIQLYCISHFCFWCFWRITVEKKKKKKHCLSKKILAYIYLLTSPPQKLMPFALIFTRAACHELASFHLSRGSLKSAAKSLYCQLNRLQFWQHVVWGPHFVQHVTSCFINVQNRLFKVRSYKDVQNVTLYKATLPQLFLFCCL